METPPLVMETNEAALSSDTSTGLESSETGQPPPPPRIDASPDPHVCPHCFETHRPKSTLQAHLRLKHPSKPAFMCQCARVFVRQSNLDQHSRSCNT